MAPAHGHEDYLACAKQGITINRLLVDNKGGYLPAAGEAYAGSLVPATLEIITLTSSML